MAAPVPVPAKIDTTTSSVDEAHDLSPTSPVDRQRMDRMMANRPNPNELQNKNILKGESEGASCACLAHMSATTPLSSVVEGCAANGRTPRI